MSSLVWGSHTGAACSSWALTMALFAFSHSEVFCVPRFLFNRKPSDLFAVLVILVIWVSQDRSFAMSTPGYLALATASRASLCIVYFAGRGEPGLVMRITWHLLGLNCRSHVISYSWRMSGSACNGSESVNVVMAR